MLGLDGWAGSALRGPGMVAFALGAVLLAGCTNPTRVSAEYTIGTDQMPLQVTFSADQAALPAQLEDTSMPGPTVARVACDPATPCPQVASVSLQCNGGVCDPDPVTLSLPLGDVYHFDAVQTSLGFGQVDSVTIESIDYKVVSNTLNTDLPTLDLYWSSAGAVQGETRLGTTDPVAAGAQPMGTVHLDDAAIRALSDHLLHTEPTARFFVEASVDVNPGDPWPAGSVEVTAIVHVRIEGSLI